MKRSFVKIITLSASIFLLCLTMMGCHKTVDITPDTNANAVGSAINPVPMPTLNRVTVEDDCVFLGSWTVQAEKSPMTSLNFQQDGIIHLGFSGGSTLSGAFYLTGDDHIELALTSSSIEGTYVVSDNTITITTDNDTLVLTKQ